MLHSHTQVDVYCGTQCKASRLLWDFRKSSLGSQNANFSTERTLGVTPPLRNTVKTHDEPKTYTCSYVLSIPSSNIRHAMYIPRNRELSLYSCMEFLNTRTHYTNELRSWPCDCVSRSIRPHRHHATFDELPPLPAHPTTPTLGGDDFIKMWTWILMYWIFQKFPTRSLYAIPKYKQLNFVQLPRPLKFTGGWNTNRLRKTTSQNIPKQQRRKRHRAMGGSRGKRHSLPRVSYGDCSSFHTRFLLDQVRTHLCCCCHLSLPIPKLQKDIKFEEVVGKLQFSIFEQEEVVRDVRSVLEVIQRDLRRFVLVYVHVLEAWRQKEAKCMETRGVCERAVIAAIQKHVLVEYLPVPLCDKQIRTNPIVF